MALPTPQEMTPKVNIRKQGTIRLQGTQPVELDKTFLKTASNAVDTRRVAEEKARAEQLEFVKTMAENDAENDAILSKAELAQHSGLNTLDKSLTIREKLQRSFDKRKQKIPEQFQPYVEQIYAKKMTRYNKFAIPYTLGEMNKVKVEAEKVYTANSINEAIEDSSDPEQFSTFGLAKVSVAAARAAKRQFGDDPELIQKAVEYTTSESIRRAVEQQAFIGRFDLANTLIDRHNHELIPADRVKVMKLMQQARSELGDKEALDIASQAGLEHEDDPENAYAYMKGAARNAKQYAAARAFYDSDRKSRKQSKQARVDSLNAEIYKQAAAGRDVKNLIMQHEPGEDRNNATKWYNDTQGGQVIATDFKAVRELTERISRAYTASQLPDDLLESYRGRISPQDMKPIESLFMNLRKNDNEGARRIHEQGYKIVKQNVDSWSKSNMLLDDERGRIELLAMDELDRILSMNPKITAEQLNARIRNVLRERGKVKEVKAPTSFFGMFNVPFTGSTTEKLADTLAPDNTPKVDPSWLREIDKLDPNLSEFQKNQVIQDQIRRGVDVSKPRY